MRFILLALIFIATLTSTAQNLWDQLNGPYGGSVKDIERTSSGKLFIATDFGGYSSSDNGASWDRITGITNFDIRDFEINPTTGRIYAICGGNTFNYFFSDDGLSWSSSSISGANNSSKIRVHPTNAAIIFVLSNNLLFRSDNGGSSFSQISFAFPSQLTTIAISSSGAVVVGCSNNSAYRSLFGGVSWSAGSQVTIDASTTKDIRSLATFNNKFYALTTDNNLYKSTDGSSNSWTSIINVSFTDTGLLYTGAINFSPDGKLLVAVDDSFWICDDPTIVTPVWNRKGDLGAWGLSKVLAGANSDVFVTGSTHAVVKSTDQGINWEQSINGITSIAPQDILETADGRIVVADDVGFYLSLDQGQSWQTNKNPPNNSLEYFRKLVELDDASILMLGGYGARKYEGSDVLSVVAGVPGGNFMHNYTFSKKTTPGSNIIYGASDQIYRSTDNAASWVPASFTGLPGSFSVQELELEDQKKYSDQGYLFIRLNDGSGKLYRVKEGTTLGEQLTLPMGNLIDITLLKTQNEDILYALSQNVLDYTISYSKDHGDTWTSVTPGFLQNSNSRLISVLTNVDVEYKGENNLTVFAEGGKIFTSFDNGITWVSETYSAPLALFKKIIKTSQDFGYLVGQGVRARRSTTPMYRPAVPKNFKVASFTFNRATFSWEDKSSLEQVYVLEKSVGTNQNYQIETEAGTNAESILLTNLLPNTTYFFRLYAKGVGGNSPKTAEVSFTTLDNSCPLSIPENRSWTSVVQRTRGPQFATLSPSTHINPDQQYTLTFDATGTELEGASKVYAHAGVVLDDSDNPVSGDPVAPWQYTKGNWGADDGIGQMTNVGNNQWELTLGSTLRNYFGAPGGATIFWLGLVFRNADGSAVATNNGVSQDVFISIEKGYVDTAVGIDISDASTKRYQMSAEPFQFFESCNVVSTLSPGTGSWVLGSSTLNFNWQEEDSSESGYITYFKNTSIINTTDPLPPSAPTLEVYPFGAKKNLIRWNKVDYSSSYKIQRGVGTYTCPSDIGGTGISYVTTNMNATGIAVFDPGPISGTVDFVQVSPGVYIITDYTFGMYQQVGYGMPGPASSFRLTHNCSYFSAIGGDFGETSWTYEIVNVTPTELTINWQSNFLEGATTVLTRSDGKSWLAQLSQDFTLPEIAEVSYPDLAYFDTDPSLLEGETYTYRVAAVNSSGQSKYSIQGVVTNLDPLFEPQINELNEVIFDGQGVTVSDLDGDGYDDIIMSTFTDQFQEQVVPLIFKNNQDGSFTKIFVPGMETENVSLYRGCVAADFNGDDLPDLLFTRTDAAVDNAVLKDILLLNQGNFSFTKTKIITKPGYANQFSAHVGLDITNDGKLDLLAVGNLDNGIVPQPSFLWEGNGNGTFTELKNVGTLTTDFINGIDASTADYDNDGDLDLLVLDRSNNVPVRLYKNNGDKTFSRVNGLEFDVNTGRRWRTSSWGDIDNDGDMDLFVATQFGDIIGARQLYKNNGDGTFSIQITSAVTEKDVSCYGSAFGDLDNDGDLDFIALSQDVGGTKIFFNNGDGTFVKYASVEALNSKYQSNIGVALGDFDNDGFLDVIPASNIGLPLTIFKNTSKGVSNNKWVKFKLKGTTSNRSAIGAKIKVTSGATNQFREIISRTGYGSQSSLTAHFGLGSSTTVDQVVITWPSGNVMTLNNLPANQLYVIDEDLIGPVAASFSPINGAIGVALDTKLDITFDEVPVGVSPKKIKVFKNSDLITPVFSIDASSGVVSNNTISFTLPSNLELFTQYTVTIEAGAITDSFQNVSTISSAWSFTTLDNVPPSITFIEVPLLDKGFASTVFSVTATDNEGVSSVTMTHRGVTSKTSSVINGVKNGNAWEFTVAESLFDAMGLEYSFTAKDVSNNEKRSPTDVTQFHKTRLNFPADQEPIVSLVGSGGNVTGYRIISIPYELSNNGISENFEELGGADPKQFRFIRYHETPSPGWDLYPGALNTLNIGEGYFVNVRNSIDIKLKDAKVPDFSQSNLFTMNLKKGWNQIGNPYTTQIVWSDVLAYNSNPTGVSNVSKFNGEYFVDPAGAIDAFEGGFVQVENDISLKIPFKGFTSGGRKRDSITEGDINKDSWTLPLIAYQGTLTYGLGAVGMDPKAKLTKDDFDLITPPKLSDYLEIYSEHPEHFMKQFTRDIVPTAEEFVWQFHSASNVTGQMVLEWDNTSLSNGGKDLYLLDLGIQKIVNMSEVNSYSFDPYHNPSFRIYFGENLESKIKPEMAALIDPYPNPSTGISNIDYALPEAATSYYVKLEVYDMMGKVLSTVVDEEKSPGFYRSQWNANANPAGLYAVRLTVQTAGEQKIFTKKIVVK